MKNNLKWYQHDSLSHQHPKFKVLRSKYGWEGEGKFWALNNLIAQADNCCLDLTRKFNISATAVDLNFTTDEFIEFIDYLVTECELLYQVTEGVYTNETLQSNLSEWNKTRKYDRQRKGKIKDSAPENENSVPENENSGDHSTVQDINSIILTNSKDLNTSFAENSDEFSANQPPPAKNKAKKKTAPAPPPEETTPHWKALVDEWFKYNKEKFGEEPSFKGRDPKDFKAIVTLLQTRAEKKGIEWNEQNAVERLKNFLDQAFTKDDWLKKNFLLSNLEKFFDTLIQKQNANTNTTNNQQPRNFRKEAGASAVANDLRAELGIAS